MVEEKNESVYEDNYPKKSGAIDDLEDALDDFASTYELIDIVDSAELEDMSHIDSWWGLNFEIFNPPKVMKPLMEIPTLELKKPLDDLMYISLVFLGPDEGIFLTINCSTRFLSGLTRKIKRCNS